MATATTTPWTVPFRHYASAERMSVGQETPFLSLISAERRLRPSGAIQWVFWVRSDVNGRSYMVGCHEYSVSCSCGQFRRTGTLQPCKHLYFLSAQIAGQRNEPNAWLWLSDSTTPPAAGASRSSTAAGSAGSPAHVGPRDGVPVQPGPGECPWTHLHRLHRDGQPRQRKSFAVPACRGFFHKCCILPWLIRNDTCPNCREPLHITSVYDNSRRRTPTRSHARITRTASRPSAAATSPA